MELMEELTRLMRDGRLGHAYVIDGDPLGEGRNFSEALAARVLSVDTGREENGLIHRVKERVHPDVHWVEPRGKLRQIRVAELSAALKKVHEKSFEDGWKIVSFLGAERMNPSSGNKLLKSLEEPPARTLLLLITDHPEQLLPTLRSRCQYLSVRKTVSETADWLPELLPLLASGPPRSLRERLDRAAAFRDFLETVAGDLQEEDGPVDEEVENARARTALRHVQNQVMEAVETWYRDVMACKQTPDAPLRFSGQVRVLKQQAESLPMKSILRIQENVRAASRKLDGNLPVQVILEQSIF